ncbi:hypothetical protein BU24DRAFT_428671 [Aaosphaeria arxii CBS 175.79]|uniref:Calcofluor white hypersensitive protein n=1 Tax=Aaosphaeria arxii CBS 175.79 TaxID=1450172 RepID=A0A6A5X8C6_9PLEO|nr:uncharacterized protein BU24DRAFT_428671 [Aaosphaeria arxii CBS 175.79]KAF2009149.1 hypothetical protein BU24DRAFT_428671 [Aaosphaeria arxii CBS 175.79]
MAGRFVKIGGIAAAAGAGYYLYNAGGDPKLAEKKFEHDAAAASARVRGELPGREKEAKKAGEEGYEAIRSKAQELSNQAKAEADKAGQKFESYRQDAAKKFEETRQEAGKEINQAVDKFDKTVSEGAEKSKSWVGSWFGGK